MFNKPALALITGLLGLFGFGSAQDLSTSMTDWYNGVATQQSAEQNAVIWQMVQQVMQNPQVQTMYQQHLASGGGGSFEEFAYGYAATCGYTPQCMAQYGQVSSAINDQQAGAMADLSQARADNAAALNAYSGGYIQNSQEMGNVIVGNETYYGPQGSAVLPYGWQPNTTTMYNGQTYYVDPYGQYNWVDPNTGWYYPIHPAQ